MVAICEYVGFHKNVNKLCTGFENFEVSPSTLFSKGNPKRLPLIFGKVNYDIFFLSRCAFHNGAFYSH